MVKPLSNDLRERVVAFVEAGHSRRAAAAHLRVSQSFDRRLSSSSAEAFLDPLAVRWLTA